MARAELLHPEIVKALERGATIVTGNQRASRTLRHSFDLRNRSLGLATWRPAEILAWDAWTTTLWRKLLIDGHASLLLLNQIQEHTIWRQILAADNNLESLRSQDALAQQAADAWQRLCSYNGQNRLRGTATSYDTQAFERWSIEFQRRCRDGRLLVQAELEHALSSAAKDGHLRLDAQEIVLLGFDLLTPAQTSLVEAIRQLNCTVIELPLAVPAAERLLIRTENEDEEIAVAAKWARRLLEQQPEARIAVVLPALDQYRAKIDRVFRAVLAPELQNIEAAEDTCPYEFSLGIPLARTPMVRAALDLLHLATEPISLDRASALILSPYFSMKSSERDSRAEFDAFELRKEHRLRPEISLSRMFASVSKSRRMRSLGQLPAALRAMKSEASRLNANDRRLHSEWAGKMRLLLEAAQWGAEHETSIEFQIRRKWESALDELATLDFDGSRVEFSHALESLEYISQNMMFAPESHDAPVQIIGALEAAGSTFDAVWLMRAGDLDWPTPASTNPLLPWRIQRELAMPGIDAARDDKAALMTTERIMASASTIIVSYAVEANEGKQRPSPLLGGLNLSDADLQQVAPAVAQLPLIELESIKDSEPIASLPDDVVRGGAQILKNQAACPFRAFAQHRLWSTEIEQPEIGMDARQSGTAVHRILELFWDEVKTQQDLKQLPRQELDATLNACIHQSLAEAASSRETPWDVTYMQMQHDRLRNLLLRWLELEMKRPPFEVALSEKTLNDVSIGPLRLNVRVDRVDQVEGGEILIDYKTGEASPKAWSSDRPDEPQLPLYATLSNSVHLQGVAFGLVRPGEDRKLIGYGARDGLLPTQRLLEKPSLQDQVADWKRVLITLATDFHDGDARVEPKAYPKTCSYCAQRILCRLDTSRLEDSDDEEVARG